MLRTTFFNNPYFIIRILTTKAKERKNIAGFTHSGEIESNCPCGHCIDN